MPIGMPGCAALACSPAPMPSARTALAMGRGDKAARRGPRGRAGRARRARGNHDACREPARQRDRAAQRGAGSLMAQVILTINGRDYPIACDDGQEERIRQLGQYVDGKVAEFAKKWGKVGDARLILMASLVITDELAEA